MATSDTFRELVLWYCEIKAKYTIHQTHVNQLIHDILYKYHTYKRHDCDKVEQVALEIFSVATDNCTANHNMHKNEQTLSVSGTDQIIHRQMYPVLGKKHLEDLNHSTCMHCCMEAEEL